MAVSYTHLDVYKRQCQSVLGTKLHEKNPHREIESIFMQVAGTIFDLMRNYEYRWRDVIGSIQGFIMGDFKFVEAERFKANYNELMQKFYEGQEAYKNIWKIIFEDTTHREFRNTLSANSPENVTLSVAVSYTHLDVYKRQLIEGEVEKLVLMEDRIKERVIGQDEAISVVSNAIRRARAGLGDPNKPIGSFIFLGPTRCV